MKITTASAEPNPSRPCTNLVTKNSLAIVLVPKLPPVVAAMMSNAFSPAIVVVVATVMIVARM